MSDNIPFEIQTEIIKRVPPIKSLVRFRSVSKQWKSLIDSSEFIAHHSLNHPQPHLLLVKYKVGPKYTFVSKDTPLSDDNYVSIAEDDSFPHHRFSPILPPTVKLLSYVSRVDCSHGLVCLRGCTQDREKLIVFWNPLLRKSVGIQIPDRVNDVIGFGVCPKTKDPKIIRINEAKAEVFRLSSGAWRSVSTNLPFSSLKFWNSHVVIDGVVHWIAHDKVTYNRKIYSFDLASEEFGEVIDFPDLGEGARRMYGISKIDESLVLECLHCEVSNLTPEPFCDVWMMLKNDVSKPSFTKLFTVMGIGADSLIGFRKNGQPIIIDQTRRRELEVYEPCSKRLNSLGIDGWAFGVTSYTESLLLVNHSESIIQS